MEQDQRCSAPVLNVVEANTVYRDKPSEWRITTLCFLRKPPIQKGGRYGGYHNAGRDRKSLPRHSGRNQRTRKIH
jgi:hypothetical protein